MFLNITSFALTWNDSGWVDYGKTERTKKISKRQVSFTLSDGIKSGIIYIHNKNDVTRGKKYPYLPLGTLSTTLWRRNGFLDLVVNGERRYIYKHLTEVPKFEFINKSIDNLEFKIIFNCGDAGKIALLINTVTGNNFIDCTLDISDFKVKLKSLNMLLESCPSHNGRIREAGKIVKVPFARIVKTASLTHSLKPYQIFKLPAGDNHLILYDKTFNDGACGLMFNPEYMESCEIQGRNVISVTCKLNIKKKKFRFFLWEFPGNNFSVDSIVEYFKRNNSALMDKIKKSTASKDREKNNTYKAVKIKQKIKIDGKLNDSSWKRASWSSAFVNLKTGENAAPKTRFKTLFDGDNLYFGIECEKTEFGKIRNKAQKHDDKNIFMDDSVELFIGPQNSSANYLHFVINAAGKTFDAIQYQPVRKTLVSWNPYWEAVAVKGNKLWSVEIKIPFKELILNKDVGKQWLLNVTRNNYTGNNSGTNNVYQTWSKLNTSFHDVENFNNLEISGIDLRSAYTPELFNKYNLVTKKRSSKIKSAITGTVEIISKGSSDFFLYYPNKELYFPADKTILRTFFTFKETRNRIKDIWKLKNGLKATREYLKNIEFHFKLPRKVSVVGNYVTNTNIYLDIVRDGGRHIILKPQYPYDHGEMWSYLDMVNIPVYLKHDLPVNSRVPIDCWVVDKKENTKSSVVRSYINIVKFPVVKPLKHLIVDAYWSFYNDYRTFPHYIRALKRTGFTGYAVFVGDLLTDCGKQLNSFDKRFAKSKINNIVGLANEARKEKLKIYLWDSTFNTFGLSQEEGRWGKSKYADPLYTGKLYQYDIKNITDAYTLLRGADLVSMDIEQFKRVTERRWGFFDKYPEFANKVKEMAKQQGTDVTGIFCGIGVRMMKDIKKAIILCNKKLGIKEVPPFIVWNTCLDGGNPMEGMFDGNMLYPKYNQFLNTHVYYPGDNRKIGNRTKFHREKLGENADIMCLTTVWKGYNISFEEQRDQVLECFYNGAAGINYWPNYLDQNDFYGQLLALREISPFEDIIWNGTFVKQTPVESPTQVVGFMWHGKSALLVSNYNKNNSAIIKVKNPLKEPAKVYDISSQKSFGIIAAADTISIKLGKRRTKVLYFSTSKTEK